MLALTVVLVMMGLSANAQTRFGVLGGFTSSNSSVKEFTAKSVSLYHAGVAVNIPIGSILAIQPQVLYQMKGTSLDNVGSENVKLETKNGYLEVPVQVQAGVILDNFRVYGFAEPFVGVALTNNTEATNYDASNISWDNLNMKRWEYGLGFGAGVQFWRLQLSAKYFWNFGSLCKEEGSTTGTIADQVGTAFKDGKNFDGIAFTLGIFF